LDWLNKLPNPDQSDFGWGKFMDGIDAIVMGRNTFEQTLTFGEWPYTKPLFVLSSTLQDVPEHLIDNVEIVCGEIVTLIGQLSQRGYNNLYIDGGKVVQSFLKMDLIDEMIITTVPILLGDGIPLFGKLEQSLQFSLVKTETFSNHLVKSHYFRER
jgi:dihydrofolate reductase